MTDYNDPWSYRTQYPQGMGGILSWLDPLHIFGGKKKEAPGLSHEDIMGQVALVVQQKLMAQCKTAPSDQIRAAVGYNLNAFSAWQQVLSDANIVDSIATKTVADLIGTPGMVTLGPGCSDTPVSNALSIPALGNISPTLLIGGAGLLGLVLLMGGRRGR